MYIKNNFISISQCNELILYYESNQAVKFRNTYPLNISNSNNNTIKLILEKIYNTAKKLTHDEIKLDNAEIVLWPQESFMDFHKDHNTDAIAVILYLNDNYDGGCTEIKINKDVKTISPKSGKAIFFKGKDLEHGVSKITSGSRYTIAIWYTG